MEEHDVVGLATVVALAIAHLAPPRLRFVRYVPRSWILSVAGGISVSYVFVHLLPDIADAQEAVGESVPAVLGGIERHVYVLALAGLVGFYGLHRAALVSRSADGGTTGREGASPAAFWLSIGSFTLYNGIIGYLVVRRAEASSGTDLALFAVALGVHFLVTDLGLRHHHARRYDHLGRPILVAALFLGWTAGVAVEVTEAAVGAAIAFLGGGIVLNVLKEELPEERASRFGAFAAGAAGYAAVLLLV